MALRPFSDPFDDWSVSPWGWGGQRSDPWGSVDPFRMMSQAQQQMERAQRQINSLMRAGDLAGIGASGAAEVLNTEDRFQVNMDVSHFAPEEIKVKTVGNLVEVEARHEERKDPHGFISRHFVRKYALPEGVDPKHVVSSLSSDGRLRIEAPKANPSKPNERPVPISMVQSQPRAVEGKDEGKK